MKDCIINMDNPANFENDQVEGYQVMAMTNLDNQVGIWIPRGENVVQFKYFCHGHALGTYYLHGYSVLGRDMPIALRDEWEELSHQNDVRAGDIVVWFDGEDITHSALINRVNEENLFLCSKNGFKSLIQRIPLQHLCSNINYGNYGNAYSFYRRKSQVIYFCEECQRINNTSCRFVFRNGDYENIVIPVQRHESKKCCC